MSAANITRLPKTTLSERENAVAGHLGAGFNTSDISRVLGVSEGSVRATIRNAYEKLGLGNRQQLAQWAKQNLIAREAL